ncbi:hypothetical protein EMIHUDRAFT_443168 [Emiliania huxleyi CCMP1516]|uniref:Uncharacterized protein n=2 Tax=Emiliania huxleyi TaxID=2903 RepID=A0A0D3JVG8_EMIH1|nr:hypothetical protein EMIHUDRAFT_443168 [Emiliania huxleyi CCMP1516]EOD27503.1 hypothetical protein EMIHUDRAFT_443168 [Emiliania huxleyi CCMP1516]|eukprot:XP_005779932.1 hypothetical protein EMIHUDRAFT_443168 [Emiliania huxleyi CCMP1516]
MDLAARVEALQAATDLPALRLVSHEPGMLSLDHTHVAARCAALSAALGGGVEVGLVLRRAPRLLSRSPARVQRTLAALRDLLEPLGLDALQLVRHQPTLLLLTSPAAALAPKLSRLRALTTEAEWAQLAATRAARRVPSLSCSSCRRSSTASSLATRSVDPETVGRRRGRPTRERLREIDSVGEYLSLL